MVSTIVIILSVILVIYLFIDGISTSSPFAEAMEEGDMDEAEKMLDAVIKANGHLDDVAGYGLSFLHYAALYNRQAIAAKLLQHGADIHVQTKAIKDAHAKKKNVLEGTTAISIAKQQGHQDLVAFLLDNGAVEKLVDS